MKVWKNILLLTALPITTFVVPQVLSSCSNVIEKEEKLITYTKFDETNIDSITTLDNNMYDVGLVFGKDIITISDEENTEIKEEQVKFKHWGDVLDSTKFTIEFIIDLSKMRNLKFVHAHLWYFMIGAYQSYCLNNENNIENLPENPYFKIIFPPSLKKFVYLDGVYLDGISGFHGGGYDRNYVWTKMLKYSNENSFNIKNNFDWISNFDHKLYSTNNYFVKDIKTKFDFSKSINLESFQMQDINPKTYGSYGDLIIPNSVKEYIPPLLERHGNFGYGQDGLIFYTQKEKRYTLKVMMNRYDVESNLNKRKKNFIDYYSSEEGYENDIKFVKDFSLFPIDISQEEKYYTNIYINDSFNSIDGLKLLFGGPRWFRNGGWANLNDNEHNAWFEKILNDKKIYGYNPKTKEILVKELSNIIWI